VGGEDPAVLGGEQEAAAPVRGDREDRGTQRLAAPGEATREVVEAQAAVDRARREPRAIGREGGALDAGTVVAQGGGGAAGAAEHHDPVAARRRELLARPGDGAHRAAVTAQLAGQGEPGRLEREHTACLAAPCGRSCVSEY